jgi:hypothetical protein
MPIGSAACGERLVIEDVRPGEFVSLEVLGYEAGAAAPRYGTTCTATGLAGVTLEATCQTLSESGTLNVNLGAALEAVGARCDSSLDSLVLELGSEPIRQLTIDERECLGTARFTDLLPGEYGVTLRARLDGGDVRVTGCRAQVEPGLASPAVCDKL